MNDKKTALETLADFSEVFEKRMNVLEERAEAKWNSLSKEDQLDFFCSVVRRIYKGEIENKRSYRGVLYSVFEFGPESYAPAQMAGYLAVHNAIVDENHDKNLLVAFAKQVGLTDQGAEEAAINFLINGQV